MPKLKTHKGTAKRIKRTGSGKLMRGRPFGNRLLSKKSSSQKRGYSKSYEVTGRTKKNVSRRII